MSTLFVFSSALASFALTNFHLLFMFTQPCVFVSPCSRTPTLYLLCPSVLCVWCRFGAGHVDKLLPPIITAVQEAKLNVVWICDPMHGNTIKSVHGIKTRSFDSILHELTDTFNCHKRLGTLSRMTRWHQTARSDC